MNILIDSLAPSAAPKKAQTKSYNLWFKAKVEAALDDKRPALSHQKVMEEAQELIDRKRRTVDRLRQQLIKGEASGFINQSQEEMLAEFKSDARRRGIL